MPFLSISTPCKHGTWGKSFPALTDSSFIQVVQDIKSVFWRLSFFTLRLPLDAYIRTPSQILNDRLSFKPWRLAASPSESCALAGLFNDAVDCFEYVQSANRTFGKDFQTSLLKLDNARLRLLRWDQSVGLGSDAGNVHTLHEVSNSTQDVDKAGRTLHNIQQLFLDAEGVSTNFKNRSKQNDMSLVVYNDRTDLEPVAAELHEKMRQLSIERQNHTPLRKKMKWALYEEKHVRKLIEDVTGLVNDLADLFPAAQPLQEQLCETEVSEIATDKNLPILKDIAADQDRELETVIARAIEKRKEVSYNVTFSGSNNSGFQLGHNSGSISGFSFGASR